MDIDPEPSSQPASVHTDSETGLKLAKKHTDLEFGTQLSPEMHNDPKPEFIADQLHSDPEPVQATSQEEKLSTLATESGRSLLQDTKCTLMLGRGLIVPTPYLKSSPPGCTFKKEQSFCCLRSLFLFWTVQNKIRVQCLIKFEVQVVTDERI